MRNQIRIPTVFGWAEVVLASIPLYFALRFWSLSAHRGNATVLCLLVGGFLLLDGFRRMFALWSVEWNVHRIKVCCNGSVLVNLAWDEIRKVTWDERSVWISNSEFGGARMIPRALVPLDLEDRLRAKEAEANQALQTTRTARGLG